MIIDNVKIYTEAGTFVQAELLHREIKSQKSIPKQKKKIYSKK